MCNDNNNNVVAKKTIIRGDIISDIMPKVKYYLFLSVFTIVISIGFTLTKFVYSNYGDVGSILLGIGTSFIPFISTVTLVFTSLSLPVEVLAFIGILTGIISSIQIYLIIEIALNHLPTVNI